MANSAITATPAAPAVVETKKAEAAAKQPPTAPVATAPIASSAPKAAGVGEKIDVKA